MLLLVKSNKLNVSWVTVTNMEFMPLLICMVFLALKMVKLIQVMLRTLAFTLLTIFNVRSRLCKAVVDWMNGLKY